MLRSDLSCVPVFHCSNGGVLVVQDSGQMEKGRGADLTELQAFHNGL